MSQENEVKELAQRIYLAKLCGFWSNPESRCELAEPCFTQCIDDAWHALNACRSIQEHKALALASALTPGKQDVLRDISA